MDTRSKEVRIVPYIKDSKPTYEEPDQCHDAFLQLQVEKDTDRLSDNYSYKNLNLDRLFNTGSIQDPIVIFFSFPVFGSFGANKGGAT